MFFTIREFNSQIVKHDTGRPSLRGTSRSAGLSRIATSKIRERLSQEPPHRFIIARAGNVSPIDQRELIFPVSLRHAESMNRRSSAAPAKIGRYSSAVS